MKPDDQITIWDLFLTFVWGLAVLMGCAIIWGFFRDAKADDMIPFQMVGPGANPVYMQVEVEVVDVLGQYWKIPCYVDTAATQFWVSPSLAERMGTNVIPDNPRIQGFLVPWLRIGSREYSQWMTWVFGRANGDACFIGLDMLNGPYTSIDYVNKVILAEDWPGEQYHANWSACVETLRLKSAEYDACATTSFQLWQQHAKDQDVLSKCKHPLR